MTSAELRQQLLATIVAYMDNADIQIMDVEQVNNTPRWDIEPDKTIRERVKSEIETALNPEAEVKTSSTTSTKSPSTKTSTATSTKTSTATK